MPTFRTIPPCLVAKEFAGFVFDFCWSIPNEWTLSPRQASFNSEDPSRRGSGLDPPPGGGSQAWNYFFLGNSLKWPSFRGFLRRARWVWVTPNGSVPTPFPAFPGNDMAGVLWPRTSQKEVQLLCTRLPQGPWHISLESPFSFHGTDSLKKKKMVFEYVCWYVCHMCDLCPSATVSRQTICFVGKGRVLHDAAGNGGSFLLL